RGTHNLPPVHDAKIVIVSHDHEQQIVPSKERTVGDLLNKLNIKLGEGDVVEPAQNTVIDQDEFRINIYRAVPVQIVDGASKTFAFSAAKTPRAIAQQSGIPLYSEDIVVADPVQNFIKTGAIGEQVIVDRATPIDVDLYGTPVTLRTHAKTVGELVKEKNIKLVQNDRIEPALDTPITPGQKVSFIRTGTKTETVTEDIATPVQNINDNSLAYGTTAVRQQGSPGQQTVTYQIAITNNVETGRSVIQKVVTKTPVTQIQVVGTSLSGIKGDMALAGIAPGDYNYVDYIVSHESGWRPNAGSLNGPYGLCQAFPGSKMGSAGADWQTNPITQLRWCSGYASSRYGGWANAYAHWVASHNW
ncbi:MAG TPA: ubiquitin-like domain-containing protein, partial [Methylomirabilota bacterium]|nr:ubiquitin-like domain-containing protein [Methylomirabilota bacterium]